MNMRNECVSSLHSPPFCTGILAGVWPYGIVAFLSELFVSESKAQVYGALHSFYQLAPRAASNISEYK